MDLLRSLESEGADAGPQVPECSRRGCRAEGVWQILWNNPKIHPSERRKVWLACQDHRGWLENFLQQRLFWRSTKPLGSDEESTTQGPDSASKRRDGTGPAEASGTPQAGETSR